jgi:hypothetical protein
MPKSDGDEPAALLGRFAAVRFAGGLPAECYAAFAARMNGTPMMGDWSPVGGTQVAERDGVVLDPASSRVVGLICSAPSQLVPGAGVVSLYFDGLEGGEIFCLEGALRYCGWLLHERYQVLHAEVLAVNRRMNRMLERLGVPRSALRRDARYFGGRFWDIGLFVISPERFSEIAARWGALCGYAWAP